MHDMLFVAHLYSVSEVMPIKLFNILCWWFYLYGLMESDLSIPLLYHTMLFSVPRLLHWSPKYFPVILSYTYISISKNLQKLFFISLYDTCMHK